MTKKIIASFLGLTMALMMVPGMVQGLTDEEWDDLMAEFDTLQERYDELFSLYTTMLGGTTPAAGVPAACTGITFTVDLSQGSTGNDVKCLQALLNTDPATQLDAVAGAAGSPGYETTFFGPLTHGAVVNFQNQHAAEILTPIGLTAGTGYVGPATRPVLNAMLTAAPECTVDADCLTGYGCVGGECVLLPEECTVDADCPAGYECVAETCEAEAVVEPTEGWLIARWLPTPTGVTVNWGASNVAIGAIELKARDSDITVNRIDINFNGVPWHKINYLALYDGDNAIKGSDIDSGTLSEVTFGTNYRLRLTGLDIDVSEDGVKNLTVKVNAPTIPRTPGALTMTVGTDAIRGVDTAGIYQYATCAASRVFTVAAAGLGAKIETKTNPDTPEEGIVLVDADTATEHEVLSFDLKVTRDSARVRTVTVTLDNITNINAVKLYDGSTAIGSETAAATTSFTLLEVDIVEDTTKTLTVKVEYAATSTAGSVTASVAAGDVLGVSANEETPTYSGSAAGNTIYFNASGVQVTFVSATLTETKGEATSTTDYMDGTITFKLAAVGEDVVIPTDGIAVQGWLVASATSTGVTVSPTLIMINGELLNAAATTTRTLLAGASSKTIVAQGRISDSTANLYVRLEISQVAWTGGSLSANQIKDLKTEPKIFVKP